ncbi:MAG: DUF6599 family protein [Bacteroidota bacterium]
MRTFQAYLLVLLLFPFSQILKAQEDHYIPPGPYLTVNELPQEAVIMQIREFKDQALFDYWHDCPEILLEYGFKRLIFEDIYMRMNLYHIEISEMQDSAAAFGAYSIAARAPGLKDNFWEYCFINNREALFIKGAYFVRVSTLKLDTANGYNLLYKFASTLITKVPGGMYVPPAVLTAGQLRKFRSDLRMIRGYLGLYYGFPSWVALFRGIEFSEINVLPLVQPTAKLNYARLVFKDGAELEKFQKKNGLLDPDNPGFKKKILEKTSWLFLRTGEKTAMLLESTGNDPFLNPIVQQIELTGLKK